MSYSQSVTHCSLRRFVRGLLQVAICSMAYSQARSALERVPAWLWAAWEGSREEKSAVGSMLMWTLMMEAHVHKGKVFCAHRRHKRCWQSHICSGQLHGVLLEALAAFLPWEQSEACWKLSCWHIPCWDRMVDSHPRVQVRSLAFQESSHTLCSYASQYAQEYGDAT